MRGQWSSFCWFLMIFLFFVMPALASETVHQSVDGAVQTWTISEPNVQQRQTIYPQIIFHPGDQVTVRADGCVQSGGRGKSWRRYVNPKGPRTDRFYHGLISIPDATRGLVRIQRVNSQA